MSDFPAHISTRELKISDVPDVSASWHVIGRFALTFDPAEKNPYDLQSQDLNILTEHSDLTELRKHLFAEQRRWNHFGRPPDSEAMSEIRRIVELIHGKLLHGLDK